ncbi:MAG TPA: GRP family sugar transporter, partial [Terriglobia bacterium]|nr:GRP family sugar transporter [Terriglobia bacterium]
MFIPQAYWVALLMTVVTMFCWGSWVNMQKAAKNWRFELFYWDYIWGVLVCTVILGLTLGRIHPASPDSFFNNLASASFRNLVFAFLGGFIFNFGNLFIVAAIAVAGLAVAFPVAIGLAMVVSAILNYLIVPKGNPLLLFGGVVLVVIGMVFDGLAYHKISSGRKVTLQGIVFSLLSGLGLGLFYPLVAKSLQGPARLEPYSMAFVFVLGAVVSTFPFNYVFMRRPVSGPPLRMKDYFGGPGGAVHLWGFIGGMIWAVGTVFSFVTSDVQMVGPAISYALGEGATLIAVIWGVFVWKEFRGASKQAWSMLAVMFILFLAGLICVALAPV